MMIPKQKQLSPPSTQSGFTIIECLLAVIIVTVLMVAVSPALILSVATRVQARRVEMATEAARTYIDGVRSGTIPQPNAVTPIAQQGVNAFLVDLGQADASKGPPATLTCPLPPSTTTGELSPKGYYCQNPPPTIPSTTDTSLYCINLSGSGCDSSTSQGKRNMVVQAFRGVTPRPPGAVDPTPLDIAGDKGYLLGVRVYRVDAFDGGAQLKTAAADKGDRREATFTGGVGDRKAPLVEMTTDIRTAGTSYESFRDRLSLPSPPPTAP